VPPKPLQQRLTFPEPPGLSCAEGRAEPVVWVRRVLLWHDVSTAPIRDVELKRGLNIVWSPVGSVPDAVANGHAAGKTLLCRLIRYCLGEEAFADPEDTIAIRSRFPDGAVGAEVRLLGDTWVVRRGFGHPHDDRALRAEDVGHLSDENLRGSFGSFRSELEAAVFDGEQTRLLAEMEEVHGAWKYVLAWLTRDQECRIDGLTHWRHPESSSHSPAQAARAETRLNVLRIAIGLYSNASSIARKDVTASASGADTARAAARQAEQRFAALRDELARVLNVGQERIWPPQAELLQDEQSARETHAQSLMALADQKVRTVGAIRTPTSDADNESRLEEAVVQLARGRQEAATLAGAVDRKREHAKLLERTSAERWADAREAKYPTCPYDGTPLDVDQARFVCPLPRLPDPAQTGRIAAETEQILRKVRDELAQDEARLTGVTASNASLEARRDALQRGIQARQLAVAEATKASQEAWATKGMVRRLFELAAAVDQALRAELEAKERLRAHQESQNAGLSAYSTAKLERWFDFLIRRIVSPDAQGTVTLDGNGLHPKIHWRGTRRSVALNSLQVVLFDLAAMLCSVEGDSRAPAFLVHDSPREGDLDPWTYARLFEGIFELGPDESSAPFQYIVTTTTDPPDGRVRSRIRLQLSASEEQHRLFRVDL